MINKLFKYTIYKKIFVKLLYKGKNNNFKVIKKITKINFT